MPDELIMRGKTASGETEILNFGGRTPGYAYQITEFELYPSTNVGAANYELCGTVTAGKTAVDPIAPNFNDAGLIGATLEAGHGSVGSAEQSKSIINDLFYITQDLILSVTETNTGNPINWQCKFKKVKLSSSAEAVANFNQFTIFDG